MKDNDEERKIWKELGLSKEEFGEATAALAEAEFESKPLHPALALGIGTFVLVNVGFLLSLPPVLRGRGAFAPIVIGTSWSFPTQLALQQYWQLTLLFLRPSLATR